MAAKPIIFSAPMVRAILSGTKSQTRRVMARQKKHDFTDYTLFGQEGHPDDEAERRGGWSQPWVAIEHAPDWPDGKEDQCHCPYASHRGDRLWVRETFARIDGQTRPWIETDYRATYKHGDRLGDTLGIKKWWTPSIHMPRHASRITLEVTGVRIERLQEISEADALAEGVFKKVGATPIGDDVETATGGELIYALPTQAREEYRRLWESINGPGSWAVNPWVWVVEFKHLTS